MSNKQEHNTPLSAELMQKYREGKLSPREMHRVERLLLENPFYAEAMEGMDEMGENASLDVPMGDLKSRLQQRAGNMQKSILMYRRSWQIAAAVALLAIFSWVGYFYFTNTQNNEEERMLSMQNEPAESIEPAPAPVITEESTQDLEEEKVAEQLKDEIISVKPEEEAPAGNAEEKVVPEEEIAYTDLAEPETLSPLAAQPPETMAEEVPDEQPLAISKVPQENAAQAYRSSRLLKSADIGADVEGEGRPLYTLKGRVISSEDKSAVPGTNVIIKNTSTAITTDVDGNFQLEVPENQNEVVFSSIGYQTKEKKITAADSNLTVVLEPDVEALSEVVVIGYGAQKKEDVTGITRAQPSAGYAAYKSYLKENLQYPQAARENNIEGVVKVAFEVSPTGKLQDFSIQKSLGYGCDEEAIRLIKEGPGWKAATSGGEAVSQNITVKVRFSMKD